MLSNRYFISDLVLQNIEYFLIFKVWYFIKLYAFCCYCCGLHMIKTLVYNILHPLTNRSMDRTSFYSIKSRYLIILVQQKTHTYPRLRTTQCLVFVAVINRTMWQLSLWYGVPQGSSLGWLVLLLLDISVASLSCGRTGSRGSSRQYIAIIHHTLSQRVYLVGITTLSNSFRQS